MKTTRESQGKPDSWYERYESQCWYKNTYLVNRPNQISKAIGKDGEWNNIEDAGCHFVCLSMIVGINPAHLASELMSKRYFRADRKIPSKKITGEKYSLVWDQNKPNKVGEQIDIDKVYEHSARSLVNVSIRLELRDDLHTLDEAIKLIENAHSKGLHIICGYEDHSRLVAGHNGEDYFLWDPDTTGVSLEDNLLGKYSLRRFYREGESLKRQQTGEKVEFWGYSKKLLKQKALR